MTALRPDAASSLIQAGEDMIAKADESAADLSPVYQEIGNLLKMAGEAVAERDVEIGVLRTELTFAHERANMAAENARSWFDRHENLMRLTTMPTVDPASLQGAA